MPERFVDQVSGHSTRVGAAQDLAALDIDLAAITQAGGWKSTRMPLQYAEKTTWRRQGWRGRQKKRGGIEVIAISRFAAAALFAAMADRRYEYGM
jgi:hypothetical protein